MINLCYEICYQSNPCVVTLVPTTVIAVQNKGTGTIVYGKSEKKEKGKKWKKKRNRK